MPRGKRATPPKSNTRSSTKEDAQIGARVRAVRMDRNMSQSDLGQRLGVSFQQVQKYERGVNRVTAVRLNEIAKALKTTSEELTGFDGGIPIDGGEFDVESYKLAKAFSRLPDRLKPKLRSLINSIVEHEAE